MKKAIRWRYWMPRFDHHRLNRYACAAQSNGFMYQVGVCIQSGNIIWVNGPFHEEKVILQLRIKL
ncbi:hypothetical protein ACHAWX_005218 [Stephanocyclus meneghinianus]